MQIAAELVAQQHVGMLGIEGAADQRMRRLAGADARRRRLDRRNAGAFLAHEGARRAGDLVDDRDVAGEQVGELRQEQRRPELGGQLLVEQDAEIGASRRSGEDRRVDRLVALAAGRRHHHVHGRAERVVALHARVVERQPGARRCRAAARSPSGAGRRAWGSAGPSRFREADGRCRAGSASSSMTGCGCAAVSFCQCASLPSPSEETRPMPVMTTSRGLMPRRATLRRPWPPPARRSWRRGSSSGSTLPSRPCRH